MNKILIIALTLSTATVFANRCIKCEVLRKYHEENPNKYEYYEDYLKACEEGGEKPKELNVEEMVREKEKISSPQE